MSVEVLDSLELFVPLTMMVPLVVLWLVSLMVVVVLGLLVVFCEDELEVSFLMSSSLSVLLPRSGMVALIVVFVSVVSVEFYYGSSLGP